MRFFSPSYLLLPLTARSVLSATTVIDPIVNTACRTIESLVVSCNTKVVDVENLTSYFSCLCYDTSGNYAPTIYDDPATQCLDFLQSADSTTNPSLLAYTAGFCTDPAYGPTGTITPSTAGTTVERSSSAAASPTQTQAAGSTSPSTGRTSAGGTSSSSHSPTSATPAPSPTSKSSSVSSEAGASVASVASTTFKAEGAKNEVFAHDGSLWAIFGSLFAAVFIL